MPHLKIRQMPRKQQKAVFASMNRGNNPAGSNLVLSQTRSENVARDLKRDAPEEFKKLKDSDKDKTPDFLDSQPDNPKKQSLLSQFREARLRRQEEKLEKIRKQEEIKLERLEETLRERRKVGDQKRSIQELKTRRKQAVIDEINRERKQLSDLKQRETNLQKELDQSTFGGRFKLALKREGTALAKQGLALARKSVTKALEQKPRKRLKKRQSGHTNNEQSGHTNNNEQSGHTNNKPLRRGERKLTGFPKANKGQRFLAIRTSKPRTFIIRSLGRRTRPVTQGRSASPVKLKKRNK